MLCYVSGQKHQMKIEMLLTHTNGLQIETKMVVCKFSPNFALTNWSTWNDGMSAWVLALHEKYTHISQEHLDIHIKKTQFDSFPPCVSKQNKKEQAKTISKTCFAFVVWFFLLLSGA